MDEANPAAPIFLYRSCTIDHDVSVGCVRTHDMHPHPRQFRNTLMLSTYPLNVLIYCVMSQQFRSTFWQLLRRSNTDTLTTGDNKKQIAAYTTTTPATTLLNGSVRYGWHIIHPTNCVLQSTDTVDGDCYRHEQ